MLEHATHPVLTGRVRGVLGPLTVAAFALAGVGVISALDPNQPGHYPTCPFLAVTGAYCPGCGSLRAIHALAHGDPATAMARNPFAVVTLVALTFGWAWWARRLWQGRERTWAAPAWTIYTLSGIVLVFWVLRNVPGWAWLSPA
ncbi:MAG: DUF2752 domain-containing protein [Pedococcus sp.]